MAPLRAECVGSVIRNCLPKKAFPGYPSLRDRDAGAIFQSQY
jgi:hypothetical protein